MKSHNLHAWTCPASEKCQAPEILDEEEEEEVEEVEEKIIFENDILERE
jgi:hypothetical protein